MKVYLLIEVLTCLLFLSGGRLGLYGGGFFEFSTEDDFQVFIQSVLQYHLLFLFYFMF